MSQAVKDMFTTISPSYDKLNHVLSFNIDKRWRRKTIAMIEAEKDQNFYSIDLCAGTCDLGVECLKQFPKSHVMAIDFSEAMLKAGEKKVQNYILEDRFCMACADALDLPCPDDSIDVVYCGFGVRNFDDTKKGIEECYRVLKPGGQLVVLEFFKPRGFISKLFHMSYAKFLVPSIGRLISKDKQAYQYLKDSIQGFLTKKEFSDLLEEVGFKDVKTKDFLMSVSSSVSGFKKKG